jgi:hypothetical protein
MAPRRARRVKRRAPQDNMKVAIWKNPVESKHYTQVYSGQGIDNVGTTTLWSIFGPSNGNTVETYQGTRVAVTGMLIHGRLCVNTSNPRPFRLIVYQSEKVYSTAAAVIADLLDQTASPLLVDAPLDTAFPGRVLLNLDVGHTCDNAAVSQKQYAVKKFLPLNSAIRYDETGTSGIISGQVGVIAISTSSTANAAQTYFDGIIRMYFKDGFGFGRSMGSNTARSGFSGGPVYMTE